MTGDQGAGAGGTRHVVAMGGGGFSQEPDNPLLDDFVLGLTGAERPRICFLPTPSGDDRGYVANFYDAFVERARPSWLPLFNRRDADLRAHLFAQDVIYVGGGNTANMLAIWRVHGVDAILREAWERGIVLAGLSAGAICWFSHGVTDSFGLDLGPLEGGLGLVEGSFCPHYDGEALRRPRYHDLVRDGLPAGWAADDGAAVHFQGAEPAEAVASRRHARAYRVELVDGSVVERELPTRYLGVTDPS